MALRVKIGIVVLCLLVAAWPLHAAEDEPERVVVQHILIGFKRSIPNQTLDRNRREARALAEHLFRLAQEGEDFDALVKKYSNEKYPGILLVTNTGVTRVPGGTAREDLVPKFGDTAFSLEVGEVGLASHHAALSPFGWHVIKRLPEQEPVEP